MEHRFGKSFTAMHAAILAVFTWSGHGAWAQSEAALEEIVVTAQRRNENLQSVPIAVSAFTENTLVNAGIDTSADLANIAPGLVWFTGRPTSSSIYIRGAGTSNHSIGQEQPVAMYVDGFYHPNMSAATLSLANVERVEVLRGPQGTLFGRNAVGGLINIITKTPSAESGGLLEAGYADYDTSHAKFYGTTGISDSLAADLSVYYYDQNGNWGRNLVLGEEINTAEEVISIRSKWYWEPGEATRLTLALDYSDRESDTNAHKTLIPGALGQDGITISAGSPHDSQENLSTDALIGFGEQTGVSLTAEHDLSTFSFRSLTAYRAVDSEGSADADGVPVAFFDFFSDSQEDLFTQEIHVLSSDDSPFDWIVGLFYMDRHARFNFLDLIGLDFPPGGLRFITDWETESISGFGEVTFPIAADTNLTLGVRYTSDTTDFNIDLLLLEPGLVIGQGVGDTTWSEPTWRAVLDHHFADDIMGYVSYNRGFKSGIYNVTDLSASPVNPEILDAYEIGLKTDLLNNRLRLNGVVFYNDHRDLQLEVLSGPIMQVTAPTADIWGIELDLDAVVTDRLNLRGNLSWIPEADYNDFPFAPFFLPNPAGGNFEVPMNGEGQRVVNTPEFTLNLGADYSIPTSFGHLIFSGNYYYNDGYFWTVDNRINGARRNIVNLSGTWWSTDEHWNVRLWAKNLLDEEYITEGSIGAHGDTATYGAPRIYGISVGYQF